jgi:hypothetical protein
MDPDEDMSAAREALRQAFAALDGIATPTRSRAATDAEEDIIEAARRAWENYLRLVERQFGHGG